jgi:lipopolysaccharide/colanic/teichoic acid biosynthesis glycosyltransferase
MSGEALCHCNEDGSCTTCTECVDKLCDEIATLRATLADVKGTAASLLAQMTEVIGQRDILRADRDAYAEAWLADNGPEGRFGDRPTLIVNRGQLSLANRIKKRLVDILFSAIALLVLAPVLIVVAIAIKLDSPGPVFFRQLRVGYGNRPFEIFKFRSLRHEATDRDGNKSVSVGDSRVTRVGGFIRRTSIDELPQLLNVLLGDMSLVGPRPHALGSRAGEKLFWEIDPSYWQRHALKPGITGLAQIRGFRGETQAQEDLTQRLNSDIEYLEGWTLWRDFRIMIGTVRVLVHSKAF